MCVCDTWQGLRMSGCGAHRKLSASDLLDVVVSAEAPGMVHRRR